MKKNIFKVILSLSLVMIISSNAFSQLTFLQSEAGKKFFTVDNNKVIYYPNGSNILVHNQYRLTFQTDRNLVLYNNTSPIWSSGINNADRIEFWPGGSAYQFLSHYLVWDGLVFGGGPNTIWVLQNDGNFVGYDGYNIQGQTVVVTGRPFAATGTAGGKRNNKKRL